MIVLVSKIIYLLNITLRAARIVYISVENMIGRYYDIILIIQDKINFDYIKYVPQCVSTLILKTFLFTSVTKFLIITLVTANIQCKISFV